MREEMSWAWKSWGSKVEPAAGSFRLSELEDGDGVLEEEFSDPGFRPVIVSQSVMLYFKKNGSELTTLKL